MWNEMRLFSWVFDNDIIYYCFKLFCRKCPYHQLSRGLQWKLHIYIHSEPKRKFLLLDDEISDSESNSSKEDTGIINEV